jgi:uncharacterized protein YndB with AHSA1/START domain
MTNQTTQAHIVHQVYTTAFEVRKSPKEVFNYLLYDVAKWWPEEVEGVTAKLNDEFVFRSGDSHFSKNKVIELVPDQRVVWLVTESFRKTDNFEWTGTKMIFEIISNGENSRVQYTYDGPVRADEQDRLVQICDLVVKEKLFSFIAAGSRKDMLNSSVNGMKPDYSATIEVAKSPADVFRCILDDVAKWWGGKDLEGRTSHLNDEFTIHHPGSHFSKQIVVELIPDKRVVWLIQESYLNWLKRDPHEWTGTKMVFELTGKGDKTLLHFTHLGLTPDKESYERCSKEGWDIVIKDWLYHFITEGTAHF